MERLLLLYTPIYRYSDFSIAIHLTIHPFLVYKEVLFIEMGDKKGDVMKHILVAGQIPFCLGGCPRKLKNKQRQCIINEVTCYLHCFFTSLHYNSTESEILVENILTNAQIEEGAITLIFPQNIEDYTIENPVRIPFKKGAAFDMFCTTLKPIMKCVHKIQNCEIYVDAPTTREQKSIVDDLRRTVAQSKKHIARVHIHAKKNGGYVAVVKLCDTHKKRNISHEKNLTDAVTYVTKTLS